MGHRINERNSGHTTLNGELKKRVIKKKKINKDDLIFIKQVFQQIYDSMIHDKTGRGHLHPESIWNSKDLKIKLTGKELDMLVEIAHEKKI